jgi:IS5 family transposase
VQDCGDSRGEKKRRHCSKHRLRMHERVTSPLWALKAMKNERGAEAKSTTDKSGKTRVGTKCIVWDSYAVLMKIQRSQNAIISKW